MSTQDDVSVVGPGPMSDDRRWRWGCVAGAVGTSAGGAVLFAGGLLALSGLNLRGCTFDLCNDPCLDDPTELIEAATAGDETRVDQLVGSSARERREATSCALRFGHEDVAVALVERGSSDAAVVRRAASWGYVRVVDSALAAGSDPQEVLDAIAGSTLPGDLGLGPGLNLCSDQPRIGRDASDDEQAAMVRLAVAAGAEPNGRASARDRSRPWETADETTSPMLRSAHNGRAGAVAALLDAGADPDHGGRVPGGLVGYARAELASRDRDALPAAPDPHAELSDVTPLMAAVTAGHGDVIDALLAGGAAADRIAGGRFVALHAAAARNDRGMVDRLLEAGAEPAPPLEPGTPTPSETARRLGHAELADHLDRAAFLAALAASTS